MKRDETSNKMKQDFMRKRYVIIAIICFIFGGYFILSGIQEAYMISEFHTKGNFGSNESFAERNMTERNSAANRPEDFYPDRFLRINEAQFPKYILTLFGGAVMILAGFSLFRLTKKKEIEHLREEMAGIFLLPDEKLVFDAIKMSGGELTQKEIVFKTGLSKVKVHRVLNKLEGSGIIRRYPYGMTKKIVIDGRVSGIGGHPSEI